jgi:hypothetical protein
MPGTECLWSSSGGLSGWHLRILSRDQWRDDGLWEREWSFESFFDNEKPSFPEVQDAKRRNLKSRCYKITTVSPFMLDGRWQGILEEGSYRVPCFKDNAHRLTMMMAIKHKEVTVWTERGDMNSSVDTQNHALVQTRWLNFHWVCN